MSIATRRDTTDQLLARAALYRLLAAAFRHPQHLAEGEFDGAALEEACAALAEDGGRARTAVLCARVREGLADLQALAREHTRVLGLTPRGAATPYETEWLGQPGELLQFHQLSDVAAFYKAFGLGLSKACDERADHLSVELAFMQFLCLKQAWAQEQGQASLAQTSRAAQRQFLEEHLSRWTGAFARRTAQLAGEGFFTDAGALLESWMEEECARSGVELGDPSLIPGENSTTLEDCCVGCQSSAACAARAPHDAN
jgi:TorA maturation chaperone TorD